MKNDNTEIPLEEDGVIKSDENHEEHDYHEKEDKKEKKKSVFAEYWRWPLFALLLAVALSFSFSILSEMTLTSASVAVSVIVIILFVAIAIVTDIIAVAVTVAKIGPFRAMASRKVRGSKEAIKLVQNSSKVASLTADIIGDICAILSGSAGAALAAVFIGQNDGSFMSVVIASSVSAIVAALAIFGKALGKKVAINNAERIVLFMGKIVNSFKRKPKKKKKQQKETRIETEVHDTKKN